MKTSSAVSQCWHRLQPRVKSAGGRFWLLMKNRYFWAGLSVLLITGVGVYLLLNNMILPEYTRQGIAVAVPDVRSRTLEEATALLAAQELQVEQVARRFNPNEPRDKVIDQNPRPDALVKPGRHVYLTVNSGRTPMVKLPSLEGLSVREAKNRLLALGLKTADVRPDTIPSPYPNTVTRQQPAAGDSLAQGSRVTLWYSTGLGEQYVTVPEVKGMTVAEAKASLLKEKLRFVVVNAETDEETETMTVLRQSREPGTRVREGYELRLFVTDEPPRGEADGAENG
jgi:beta-lactam-binding protein with PASTA domain